MGKKRELRKSRKILQKMMRGCVPNFIVKRRNWQNKLKELESKTGEPVINNM